MTRKQPWPWYIALPVFLACVVALVLMWCTPASAGWFGIGEAVSAVSEATWRIQLVRAVERMAPSIILLVCIVGAIGSAWVSAYLAMRLLDNSRTALRDDKVTPSEWIVLGCGAALVLPISAGLLWFAYFLMTAARSGLLELMK